MASSGTTESIRYYIFCVSSSSIHLSIYKDYKTYIFFRQTESPVHYVPFPLQTEDPVRTAIESAEVDKVDLMHFQVINGDIVYERELGPPPLFEEAGTLKAVSSGNNDDKGTVTPINNHKITHNHKIRNNIKESPKSSFFILCNVGLTVHVSSI